MHVCGQAVLTAEGMQVCTPATSHVPAHPPYRGSHVICTCPSESTGCARLSGAHKSTEHITDSLRLLISIKEAVSEQTNHSPRRAPVVRAAKEKQETKTCLKEEGLGRGLGEMDSGRICLPLGQRQSPFLTSSCGFFQEELSSRENCECKGPEAGEGHRPVHSRAQWPGELKNSMKSESK